MHPGWAAHAGIAAAVLAQSGMIGPETVFEGAHGFYAAFAGGHDDARLRGLLATLGHAWGITRLTYKPYPCGSIAHPYMDCALRLRERHRIDPREIVAVRCRTAEGPVPRLWEPLAAKHAPPNGYAAKFSLPYLIATMLVRGRAGLAEFSDAAVRDAEVLRVAGRVTYELDPTIDYPRRFVGDVRVRLASGDELVERQEHSRGGPEHPVTAAEAEAKFRGNAGLVLDGGRVDELVRRLARLRDEPGLTGLARCLVP
jgi:2-methylcitrate dehydratase PrpD